MNGSPPWGDALTALLALLPPDGARTCDVVDGRFPAAAQPSRSRAAPADLVLIRARGLQALWPAWRRRAARAVEWRLAPDGVAYVLAGPVGRALIRRALTAHDLRCTDALLHTPRAARTERLVSLGGPDDPFGRAEIPGPPSWRRRQLARALRLRPCRAALILCLPGVGLVIRRRGARSCLAWLCDAGGLSAAGLAVSIDVSWRGVAAGATVTASSPGPAAGMAVAKVTLGSAGGLDAEHAALVRLGPVAREAGAAVPDVRGRRRVGPWEALVEGHVRGRRVSDVLRRDAAQTLPILSELTGWLARWHRLTAVAQPLTAARLTELILQPLVALDGLLVEPYQAWLTSLATRLQGRTAPLVAVHNDLTMANVLFTERDGLGVVDWAGADGSGLPLMDFFYATTDALHAAYGGTRIRAFQGAFTRGGAYRPAVDGLRDRLLRALPLEPDLATAAFHACFLHHAVNEAGADPSGPRPFLELVRAAGRIAVPEGRP